MPKIQSDTFDFTAKIIIVVQTGRVSDLLGPESCSVVATQTPCADPLSFNTGDFLEQQECGETSSTCTELADVPFIGFDRVSSLLSHDEGKLPVAYQESRRIALSDERLCTLNLWE